VYKYKRVKLIQRLREMCVHIELDKVNGQFNSKSEISGGRKDGFKELWSRVHGQFHLYPFSKLRQRSWLAVAHTFEICLSEAQILIVLLMRLRNVGIDLISDLMMTHFLV